MKFEQKISLLPYNTFHIDETAEYFTVVHDEQELIEVLKSPLAQKHSIHMIGGGSNILLTQPVNGLIVLNQMKGITIIQEDDHVADVKFAGGENWHECVLWCVHHNFGGIENLSLIPGTIGAAPIQNIGAYGVELKDVFYEAEAIHVRTGEKRSFNADQCEFGYRSSLFKTQEKGNYIITSVTLRLSKNPVFNTSYGNIQQELDAMGITSLSIKAISDAVIRIRQSKLPDPAVLGNAGSFFKNPVISIEAFNALLLQFPDIPSYKNEDGMKIPAAWLIEHCGPENSSSWKGYREQNFGVHSKQALCLVNYSDASGKDIFDLSERIITSVQHTFNITLEREVNIW